MTRKKAIFCFLSIARCRSETGEKIVFQSCQVWTELKKKKTFWGETKILLKCGRRKVRNESWSEAFSV